MATVNRYEGDGSTTSFAVTFAQYSWTSIVVLLDQVEQTTGYTYNSVTKSIVFTTAPADGVSITLRRLSSTDLLYKFSQGAAFTGANLDADFNQFASAVEEVNDAVDQYYVDDKLNEEIEARQEADASLQSQITGATPVLANEMSVVTWHGQTITNSVDVPANMNAFSVGPQITIAPGQAVNLGEGSHWSILGNLFEVDELYNVTANNLTTSDGEHTVSVETLAGIPDRTTSLESRMTAEEGKVNDIAHGGTGNTTGLAASATKLATARALQTNLASTSTVDFDGTAAVKPGVTGILPVTNGGTGNTTGLAASATKLATARSLTTNLASTTAASFDGSADASAGVTGILPITNGGTGNTTGLAASTTKLATSRTFQTNLASTTAAGFDGTANNAHGVTGTLPIANGGTGGATIAAAMTALGQLYSSGVLTVPNSAGTPIKIQCGSSSGTTDSSGNLTITYPTAFSQGVLTVIGMNGESGSGDIIVSIVSFNSANLTNFTAHFSGSVSQARRIQWIAIGI